MTPKLSSALCSVLALSMSITSIRAQNGPDGPTGTVSEPLVGGALVDQQTQYDFGLLTLNDPGASCSASMINQYWAITAAHCVFSSPSPGVSGLVFQPAQITSDRRRQPGAGPTTLVTKTPTVAMAPAPPRTGTSSTTTRARQLLSLCTPLQLLPASRRMAT